MHPRSLRVGLLALLLCSPAVPAAAAPVLIDFEGLPELVAVGTIGIVTFSDALTLTAGTSLNEIEFPPRSGVNVVFNSDVEMRLDFAAPVSDFAAYFTYVTPVTANFFSASSTLLGTAISAGSENFVSSGGTPNELIAGPYSGIAYVTLSSSAGAFVMDDLSFNTAETTAPVPEPASLLLMGSGAAVWLLRRRAAAGRG